MYLEITTIQNLNLLGLDKKIKYQENATLIIAFLFLIPKCP